MNHYFNHQGSQAARLSINKSIPLLYKSNKKKENKKKPLQLQIILL